MNIIKPKALKKGATIGILSAAGNIEDVSLLEASKKYFENKGYKVKISPNAYESDRYLSGSDNDRLEALNNFFLDDSIDAVIAARGGYGSIRLLNNIDYEIVKKHPKIFAGYSDITALSLMFYKKAGLITFNGPMAVSDFSREVDSYTEKSFFDTLQEGIFRAGFENISKVYKKGNAEGILWGGNLSTVVSLAGMDFLPDEKFIFFCEDINEPVYKIDRMFTQLMNIEKFRENIAGIVLGNFCGLDSQEYFDDFFMNLQTDVPIKSGLNIGHKKTIATLPIGVKCVFDTNLNCISFS